MRHAGRQAIHARLSAAFATRGAIRSGGRTLAAQAVPCARLRHVSEAVAWGGRPGTMMPVGARLINAGGLRLTDFGPGYRPTGRAALTSAAVGPAVLFPAVRSRPGVGGGDHQRWWQPGVVSVRRPRPHRTKERMRRSRASQAGHSIIDRHGPAGRRSSATHLDGWCCASLAALGFATRSPWLQASPGPGLQRGRQPRIQTDTGRTGRRSAADRRPALPFCLPVTGPVTHAASLAFMPGLANLNAAPAGPVRADAQPRAAHAPPATPIIAPEPAPYSAGCPLPCRLRVRTEGFAGSAHADVLYDRPPAAALH